MALFNSINSLYLISFLDLFGISIIIPLFGDHLRSLGISHSLIGVLGSTYAALQLLSGPVIGSWSDLRGRKKILILTLFICTVNYIVFGLSSSIIVIFLTRIISGIFKHTQNLVRSVIADCVPPDIQPEVCGRLNAISGFGFIIGPVIGGHLAETPNGFTILCLLTSSLLFISLGVTYFFLPNLVMTKSTKGTVTKSDLNSVDSTEQSFSVIGSVYNEIAKAASELKQVNWKIYSDVFLLKFLLGFALAMYYGGSRFIWVEVLNITPKTIGYLISFQSIIGALAGFFCGWIDSQFYKNSHDNVKNFHGFFILACSFIGLSLSRHVFLLILFLIPLAFSSSLLRIFGTETMLKRSLPDQRGSLIGTSNSLSSLARLIAPLLSGIIGDLCGQYAVLHVSVFISMLAAFISFRWKNVMKKND